MPLRDFDPNSIPYFRAGAPTRVVAGGPEFTLPQLRTLAHGLGFVRPSWCTEDIERVVLVGWLTGALDEIYVTGVCLGEFVEAARSSVSSESAAG